MSVTNSIGSHVATISRQGQRALLNMASESSAKLTQAEGRQMIIEGFIVRTSLEQEPATNNAALSAPIELRLIDSFGGQVTSQLGNIRATITSESITQERVQTGQTFKNVSVSTLVHRFETMFTNGEQVALNSGQTDNRSVVTLDAMNEYYQMALGQANETNAVQQSQIIELQETVDDLQIDLRKIKSDYLMKQEQIKTREDELAELQNQLDKAIKDLKRTKEENQDQLHEIRTLNSKIKTLKAKIEELNKENTDLECKLFDANEKLNYAIEDLDAAKEQIAAKNRKIEWQKTEINELQNDVERLDNELNRLKRSLLVSEIDLNLSNQNIECLEDKIDDFNNLVSKLGEDLASSGTDLNRKQSKLKELKDQLTKATKEDKPKLEAEIVKLARNIDSTKRDIRRMEFDIEGKKQAIDSLRSRFAQAQEEKLQLDNEVDKLKSQLRIKEKQLADVRYDYELQLEEQDDKIDALEREKAQTIRDKQRLQEANQEAGEINQALLAENKKLIAASQTLEDTNQMLTDMNQVLREQGQALRIEIEERQDAITGYEKELRTLEKKRGESEARLADTQSELEEKKRALKHAKSELQRIKDAEGEDAKITEQTIKRLQQEIQDLEQALDERTQTAHVQNTKFAAIKAELQTANEQYAALEEELEQKDQQILGQIGKLENQQRAIERKNEELQALCEELEIARADLKLKNDKIRELENKIRALEAQIRELKAELNQLEATNIEQAVKSEANQKKLKLLEAQLKTERQTFAKTQEAQEEALEQCKIAEKNLEVKRREFLDLKDELNIEQQKNTQLQNELQQARQEQAGVFEQLTQHLATIADLQQQIATITDLQQQGRHLNEQLKLNQQNEHEKSNQLQQNLDVALAKERELQDTLQNLQDDYNQTTAKVRDLELALENATNEVILVTKRAESAENNVSRLTIQLDSENTEKQQVQRSVKKLQLANEKLTTENAKQAEEILQLEALKAQIIRLEAELKTLEQKNLDAGMKNEEQKADLEAKLKAVKAELEQTQSKLAVAEDEAKKAKFQTKESDARAKTSLEQKQAAIYRQQDELRRAGEAKSDLEGLIGKKDHEIGYLKSKIQFLEQEAMSVSSSGAASPAFTAKPAIPRDVHAQVTELGELIKAFKDNPLGAKEKLREIGIDLKQAKAELAALAPNDPKLTAAEEKVLGLRVKHTVFQGLVDVQTIANTERMQRGLKRTEFALTLQKRMEKEQVALKDLIKRCKNNRWHDLAELLEVQQTVNKDLIALLQEIKLGGHIIAATGVGTGVYRSPDEVVISSSSDGWSEGRIMLLIELAAGKITREQFDEKSGALKTSASRAKTSKLSQDLTRSRYRSSRAVYRPLNPDNILTAPNPVMLGKKVTSAGRARASEFQSLQDVSSSSYQSDRAEAFENAPFERASFASTPSRRHASENGEDL